MTPNGIPSEEDFERARARMRERDRGLSEVRSSILEHFKSEGLHEAIILYSRKNDMFFAHMFYCQNSQVAEASKSGLTSKIQHAIVEELTKARRGSQGGSVNIQFEWDSDENVKANFEGDYYLRIR